MNQLQHRLSLSCLAIALALVGYANRTSAAERPKVGDSAADFTAMDKDGNEVQFALKQHNGLKVLIFLRGFPGYQCPICTRQIGELVAVADEIAEANAKVFLVYPGPAKDLAERANEFKGAANLPKGFTLLLDPDYKITNLYNLRWEAPRETAYPSTFVVDETGKITFAKISESHGGRATAKEVLSALRELSVVHN